MCASSSRSSAGVIGMSSSGVGDLGKFAIPTSKVCKSLVRIAFNQHSPKTESSTNSNESADLSETKIGDNVRRSLG